MKNELKHEAEHRLEGTDIRFPSRGNVRELADYLRTQGQSRTRTVTSEAVLSCLLGWEEKEKQTRKEREKKTNGRTYEEGAEVGMKGGGGGGG